MKIADKIAIKNLSKIKTMKRLGGLFFGIGLLLTIVYILWRSLYQPPEAITGKMLVPLEFITNCNGKSIETTNEQRSVWLQQQFRMARHGEYPGETPDCVATLSAS